MWKGALAGAAWAEGPHLYKVNGYYYLMIAIYYGGRKGDLKPLIEGVDGRILSPDAAGGFVGAYIGLYASSNGILSYNHADFGWFEYKEVREG